MLPPVHIIQGASNYQPARSTPPTQPDMPASAADPAVPATGLDLKAAIAGRLGILLLAGTDGGVDSLSLLADLIGRSLGTTRGEDETPVDYMRRLSEMLVALPPERRVVIQRQIAQLFNGTMLSVIIAALADPSGPTAMRLGLQMETANDRDGDPLTRGIVTSYRQNGAEPTTGPATRALPDAASVAARPLPAAVSNPGVAAGPEAGTRPAPANASNLASRPSPVEPGVLAGARGDRAPQAIGDRLGQEPTRAGSGERSLPSISSSGASPPPRNGQAELRSVPLPAQVREGSGDTRQDAVRRADAVLSQILAQSRPAARADDTSPARAGGMAGKDGATLPSTSQRPILETRAASQPAIGEPHESPVSTRRENATSIPWVPKTWPQTGPGPDIRPPTSDSAIDSLLRNSLLGGATAGAEGGETARGVSDTLGAGSNAATRQAGLPDERIQSRPSSMALDTDEETQAAQQTGAKPSDSATPRPVQDLSALPSIAAAVAREGLAVPFVGYLFAADEPEEAATPRGQLHQEGEEAGDEHASEDDAEGEGDGSAEGEEPDAIASETLIAHEGGKAASEADSISDRANDLYWRMAGWA